MNYRGVTRTARLTQIIVAVVMAALIMVVAAGLLGGQPDPTRLTEGHLGELGVYGVLQSAGLLFFAFAGYARIATMGEEVRDPQRTIPRAIVTALGIAVAVYAVVGVTALLALGPDRLAASTAPLADVVGAGAWGWAVPVVAVGGAAAAWRSPWAATSKSSSCSTPIHSCDERPCTPSTTTAARSLWTRARQWSRSPTICSARPR